MQLLAPAKLNLSLEILGRRADGYHEIVSVMQTISLADSLSFDPAPELSVQVVGAELPHDNLVARAAGLMRSKWGGSRGCTITLEKEIPIAAGLGGGSSDAAATMLGLAGVWQVKAEDAELNDMALALGSDVPFFLQGGTALIEGRGERVTALPATAPSWYVLANPRVPVLTAAVYAGLRPSDFTDGGTTRGLADGIAGGGTAAVGCNGLQGSLFRLSREARECFDALSQIAPGPILVSGSGPTVFAPCDSVIAARDMAEAVRALGYWSHAAQSTTSREATIPCA